MRLYIVRHGESETNKNKLWTGWLDVPLTEKGMRDAEAAGSILSGIKFDKVYSSDLSRATKTCEIALGEAEYETTPILREVNVGKIAGRPLSVISEDERAEAALVGYKRYDGESREELEKRVEDFLALVAESGHRTVAAFSHAGFIRTALSTVVGINLPGKKILCNNCTVAVFEYSDGLWRLHSWINSTDGDRYDGN